MKDYVKVSLNAYESLAVEFKGKIQTRKTSQKTIIKYFLLALDTYVGVPEKILEIGPAAGYTTELLCVENRHKVTAIEISPKLAEYCKDLAPCANVLVGDFLDYDFERETYDGILAIAFIHLFPKKDSNIIYEKIKSLLNNSGIVFLSTTLHDESTEGFERKTNFEKENLRFRRRFTQDELLNEIAKA